MAFIEEFEHDIIVSYAHVDNLPDREGDKGWVERFEHQLGVRLLKRFGEQVDVWRDPKLNRAELFDDVIQKVVQNSGIMISLLTSRYLKSEYCAREINWFRQKSESEAVGFRIGDHIRIFPILLYNIPPEEWPDPCQGTSGFCFHDAEGDEFGSPLAPDSDDFQNRVGQLVEELYLVLTRLRSETTIKPDAAGLNAGPGSNINDSAFKVFVANTSDDLRPTRRHIVSELENQGIAVQQEVPPPYQHSEHTAAVRELIEQVDLCVHLLSTRPGELIESEKPSLSYPMEQLSIAEQHARSQLILLPEEFNFDDIDDRDREYSQLLASLKKLPRDADKLEIIQTGRHQMLDEIYAKQAKLEKPADNKLSGKLQGSTAFIDLHTNDVPHATDMVSYLSQQQINPVMIPSAGLSPKAGMSLFEDNLKKAQLFIVVFGAVAREWVEQRLNEAFKLILSNQLPTRIGVYIAPPRKETQQVAFPGLFEVMNNMEQFNPQTLEAFLQNISAE